jgi:hypothetical protein
MDSMTDFDGRNRKPSSNGESRTSVAGVARSRSSLLRRSSASLLGRHREDVNVGERKAVMLMMSLLGLLCCEAADEVLKKRPKQ